MSNEAKYTMRDFDDHPECVTPSDLNNFAHLLEGGFYRRCQFPEIPEIAAMFHKRMTQPLKESVTSAEGYSERMLAHPQQHFFDDIDAAVKEAGLRVEDLQRVGYYSEEIQVLLLPVYHILRRKGYRHHELIQ